MYTGNHLTRSWALFVCLCGVLHPAAGQPDQSVSKFATDSAPSLVAVPNQIWRSLGPQPTIAPGFQNAVYSGRIDALAVAPNNPDIILIGATGGLWRSDDGGGTFVPVADNQVDLSIGSIAFSSSNPSIVYAGMGDGRTNFFTGNGVLKSTDSGRTWTHVSQIGLPDYIETMKLYVDPTSSDRVYLAAYRRELTDAYRTKVSAGFYLSTDGGVTWTNTLGGYGEGFGGQCHRTAFALRDNAASGRRSLSGPLPVNGRRCYMEKHLRLALR